MLMQLHAPSRQTALTDHHYDYDYDYDYDYAEQPSGAFTPPVGWTMQEISPEGDGLVKIEYQQVDVPSADVKADNALLNDIAMPNKDNWKGTPWFGGSTPCFPGDSSGRWTAKIGIMVDGRAVQDTNWQQRISAMVSAASIIYEKQMNIELEVAWTITANDGWNSGTPLLGAGCSFWYGEEKDSLGRQLNALKEILKNPSGSGTTLTEAQRDEVITTHLFTGCDDNGYGTVGLASMGVLGNPDAAGVDNIKASWQTFAHELGHNFGAEHTFEPGSGGGIMDYDNGKTGGTSTTIGVGTFEFNPLRQCQVCSELTELRISGHPGFTQNGWVPPAGAQTGIAAGCVCEDAASTGWTSGGQVVTCAMAPGMNMCSKDGMTKSCPVSCGVCGGGGSNPAPPPHSSWPAPPPAPPPHSSWPAPPPAPPPASSCQATCYERSCDDWVNGGDMQSVSCDDLTNSWGCDCSGCSLCGSPPPPPAPSSGASCSDTTLATWQTPCFSFCGATSGSAEASCLTSCTVTCTCGDWSSCSYTAY